MKSKICFLLTFLFLFKAIVAQVNVLYDANGKINSKGMQINDGLHEAGKIVPYMCTGYEPNPNRFGLKFYTAQGYIAPGLGANLLAMTLGEVNGKTFLDIENGTLSSVGLEINDGMNHEAGKIVPYNCPGYGTNPNRFGLKFYTARGYIAKGSGANLLAMTLGEVNGKTFLDIENGFLKATGLEINDGMNHEAGRIESYVCNTGGGNRFGLSFYTSRGYIAKGGTANILAMKLGEKEGTTVLDVYGTIHSQEVKVVLDGWSDFVFVPTYKLMPLTQVEQFVKTNGHLPEIPSTAEVKENGLNLGEMQNKLLQKIEEMTLYMIEQQKQIEELKKQVVELKK